MHFITGGAFNGKEQWVKQYYPTGTTWFLASDNNFWPVPDKNLETIIILEGVEKWIKKEINVDLAADIILEKNIKKLDKWLEWEQKKENRRLVLIGTDISKGIVPMEKESRLQRDVTGWFYQRLVKRAERVDQIWYGISEVLKIKED